MKREAKHAPPELHDGYYSGEEIKRLREINKDLLAAAKAILSDLESGFIAQDSHRGDANRRKRETMLRAAIAKAEGSAA